LEERADDPIEALVVAHREVGSLALAHDRSRDVWIAPGLQDIGRDFRFALRLLRKDRSFTAIVAIVLGLGIGVASLQYVPIFPAASRAVDDGSRLRAER
jgi:hypothetical protein